MKKGSLQKRDAICIECVRDITCKKVMPANFMLIVDPVEQVGAKLQHTSASPVSAGRRLDDEIKAGRPRLLPFLVP